MNAGDTYSCEPAPHCGRNAFRLSIDFDGVKFVDRFNLFGKVTESIACRGIVTIRHFHDPKPGDILAVFRELESQCHEVN